MACLDTFVRIADEGSVKDV